MENNSTLDFIQEHLSTALLLIFTGVFICFATVDAASREVHQRRMEQNAFLINHPILTTGEK